jgi:hypothetical protein
MCGRNEVNRGVYGLARLFHFNSKTQVGPNKSNVLRSRNLRVTFALSTCSGRGNCTLSLNAVPGKISSYNITSSTLPSIDKKVVPFGITASLMFLKIQDFFKAAPISKLPDRFWLSKRIFTLWTLSIFDFFGAVVEGSFSRLSSIFWKAIGRLWFMKLETSSLRPT